MDANFMLETGLEALSLKENQKAEMARLQRSVFPISAFPSPLSALKIAGNSAGASSTPQPMIYDDPA
jgi:hypothetical protein